jgi:PDZ domain-containing protein
MRRPVRVLAVLVPLALAFGAGWIRLPYYALGPGPARDVAPLIRIEGHERYDSSGHLIMTTVSLEQVTALRALIAWLDPATQVVARDEVFAPGVPQQLERQRALSQMEQSKVDATQVVLEKLADYPAEHGDGALVEAVVPGCPAEGAMKVGDTILSIGDQDVAGRREALALLDEIAPTKSAAFEVESPDGGKTRDVTMRRADCVDGQDPLFGFGLIDTFPFSVRISTGDVGGPSAGLMWALGLYDLLTPGDLTGGRTIAGTGSLDAGGRVGPIGGIGDKITAAERLGADVFLAPEPNMDEIRQMDTGDLKVVPVGSFTDALEYLQAN